MGNIDSLQEEIFQIQHDISAQTAESVRLTDKANAEYADSDCLPKLLHITANFALLCCLFSLCSLLIPVLCCIAGHFVHPIGVQFR